MLLFILFPFLIIIFIPNQIPRLPVNGTLQHCSAQTSPEMNTPRCPHTGRHGCEQTRSEGRKNSLPEITGQPDVEVKRINPKISKETQCCLSTHGESPLEEQFIESEGNNWLTKFLPLLS